MSSLFLKDPGAREDYVVDWTGRVPTGDTIATVAWAVPTGLVNAGTGRDGLKATVILDGGTAGTEYHVECTATTTAGLVLPHGFVVLVDDTV